MLIDKLACSVHGSKISDAGVCPKNKVDAIGLIRWFLSRFESNQRCTEYFLEFSLLMVSRWSRMVAGTRTIGCSVRNVGLKMNLCYVLRTSIPPFDEVLSIFRESWMSSIIMLIILRALLFVEAGLFLAFVDVSPKLSRLQKPKRARCSLVEFPHRVWTLLKIVLPIFVQIFCNFRESLVRELVVCNSGNIYFFMNNVDTALYIVTRND